MIQGRLVEVLVHTQMLRRGFRQYHLDLMTSRIAAANEALTEAQRSVKATLD